MVISIAMLILPACASNRHAATSPDSLLRKKYSGILGIPEGEIANMTLYRFIDDWYGVPYKYGGKSKTGVDCSGFTAQLYTNVYRKTIPCSANGIYEISKNIPEKKLEEGDLVFFKINTEKVSHVGVYLRNRKFVHASSKNGVIISSLDEAYYKKHFFKGGKIE